ncbi:MAG TPA: YpdA family putative bacillithiol disulfide reductase [Thermoanaerobaculia bacterium]|nr:YpdA family putative bacillithiol disulfide reductase [Thermoanaerobaculia bacterium]
MSTSEFLDLLVVGAGPTGIAIGAEARQAGLTVLLVDRGPLTAAIQAYPTFLEFFTTRDRLEIAGIPFAIPESKPSRRQALVYYRSVVEHYGIPLALHEEVLEVARQGEDFAIQTRQGGAANALRTRRARAVALATGYFDGVKKLGVAGEDLPWVHHRYVEPYRHFGQQVVIVGAGNTAVEAALDLWRNGVHVTLIHRGQQVKRGVKYWLKPDIENRIAEGSIAARFDTVVRAFGDEAIEIATAGGVELLPAHAAFVLIGYLPDAEFERRCGIAVDPRTLVPAFDPESCESNVPGLYIAGTIQAGSEIDRIFIENSREHGPRIVRHLERRLRRPRAPQPLQSSTPSKPAPELAPAGATSLDLMPRSSS